MVQAVYWLPAEVVGYISLVWVEKTNNTHTILITRQLWVVSHQLCSCISVLTLLLTSQNTLNVYSHELCPKKKHILSFDKI